MSRLDVLSFGETTPSPAALPPGHFDRVMFNLHEPSGRGPLLIVGAGLYVPAGIADGYAILVTGDRQRNLRFSEAIDHGDGRRAGPLSWFTDETNSWRLRLEENPAGVELDVTWLPRAPAWVGDLVVANPVGPDSTFEHLFQSGRYQGGIRIDGVWTDVDGWFGQRDRSRGVRSLSGGQGLHLWCQAQFEDRSIGFLMAEDRSHRTITLEGAVMHEDGRLDDIVEVSHHLEFDAGLDLRDGRLSILTASGIHYDLSADATGRGAYMAGGGYGGGHGHGDGTQQRENSTRR
jgi:hypothetical protein